MAGDVDCLLSLLASHQTNQEHLAVLGDHLDLGAVEVLGAEHVGFHLGGDPGVIAAGGETGRLADAQFVVDVADPFDATDNFARLNLVNVRRCLSDQQYAAIVAVDADLAGCT